MIFFNKHFVYHFNTKLRKLHVLDLLRTDLGQCPISFITSLYFLEAHAMVLYVLVMKKKCLYFNKCSVNKKVQLLLNKLIQNTNSPTQTYVTLISYDERVHKY